MKQKKFGKCAICGNDSKLSADHIPPKCCGNNSDTYYIQYTPDFLGDGARHKPIHSQNGLTFTNICEKCNNTMGSRYDAHLQYFRDCIISLIEGNHYHGKFVMENVCKSIIGHFLAVSKYDPCTFAQAMRNYYLNDDKTIYEGYSLLCAYYPYKDSIFSLNDYVPVNLCGDNIPEGMISSLYFYPFAFIFCEKQKSVIGSDLFEMCRNKCLSLKVSSEDWNKKAPCWPAVIDDGHAILASAAMNDSKFKVKMTQK